MSEITIDELLKGKSTIIKNKEYYPTKMYVEPFLEKMSAFTNDFSVQVKLPDQMTMKDGKEDVTYNRVLIQAKLPPEHTIDNHDEIVGFLYGLDVKKPVAKIYRGYLNMACTNLSVFNPTWLNIQEIQPETPINYNPIKELLESTSNFANILAKLKSIYLDRLEQKRYLGEWVDYTLRGFLDYGFGKVKITQSTPIDVYKSLFINQESEYFIPEGVDPTLFDVHEAFTQIITDDKRDIMNKFEKTIIINKLLGIQNEGE